ncbi:putative DCC family thiol-disulfide oxidoreductase YuxK [Alkalihalobacillus xiaoxiensis]|uniref:DCC family thiol-disulfide oxidoreductase YuxK n=2 Tax=Shouchella xiaoxiensis TaxID=766895 RepID=A0ABS2SWU8_9BACI|nr:putative DCC family thiol-disulfide oxidoreductase YuxK [Shouchella xiaoxiensis]
MSFMMANAHSVVLQKKIIRSLDWRDQINWVPVQSVSSSTKTKAHQVTGINMYEEIYVVTNKDKVAIGYRAIQEIISVLPSTSWLTWFFQLSLIEAIGHQLYQYISKKRHQWFGRLPYYEAFS